ncbi:MAG TPA: hypothetical protein EYG68_09045 [Leucothrix mucor]|nr:hypothetical protein [Leucothrix mucor]
MGSRIAIIAGLVVLLLASILFFNCSSVPKEAKDKVVAIDEAATANVKPTQTPSDEITLNNLALELISNQGQCQLKHGTNELIDLSIKAPCYFVRQNKQVFEYQQRGQNVIAIIGDILEKSKRCGRVARGVLITEKGISLSSRIAKGSIYCANKGLDNAQYDLFGKTK